MQAGREIIWEFGNVVSYKISLTHIDPLIARELGQRSLLDVMVEDDIFECLTPIVAMVIQDKWETYAKCCMLQQVRVLSVAVLQVLLLLQANGLFT